MAEPSSLPPAGTDFEKDLESADKTVAQFASDDRTAIHRAKLLLRKAPTIIPAAVLVLSYVGFGLYNPNFFKASIISTILQQMTVTGFIALAQTIVILTAGIDLSVGVMMVFSSLIMGNLAVSSGLPAFVAIAGGMATGAAMGYFNGFLVARFKLPPFIVTLGTLSIYRALLLAYSGSESIRNVDIEAKAPVLLFFGEGFEIGSTTVTYGMLTLFLLAAFVWYVLSRTAWGRHVHAIGDEPDAAMLSGIQVDRTLISVYTAAGFICGITAWVAIGRVGSISPLGFETVNLGSITAVVIGGTSLFGGRGSVVGSVLGAIIVQVFTTGLSVAARVDDYWQTFAAGCLVIVAVALDQYLRRASK